MSQAICTNREIPFLESQSLKNYPKFDPAKQREFEHFQLDESKADQITKRKRGKEENESLDS